MPKLKERRRGQKAGYKGIVCGGEIDQAFGE